MPSFCCCYCSYCWCWWCLAGAINCMDVCVCVRVDCSEFIYLLLGFQNIQLHFMLYSFECVRVCVCVCVPFGSFLCCFSMSICVPYNIYFILPLTYITILFICLLTALEQVDALHIFFALLNSLFFVFLLFFSTH